MRCGVGKLLIFGGLRLYVVAVAVVAAAAAEVIVVVAAAAAAAAAAAVVGSRCVKCDYHIRTPV